MAEEGKPVPSAGMYIGICTTRAQSANLRWQKAVVFVALNGAVGNLCFNVVNYEKAASLFAIAWIAVFMFFVNMLFRGLVDRANQWIEHYTRVLKNIEKAHGTESGIFVFGADDYLSYQEAESSVRGFRFRRGIKLLSDVMLWVWGGVGLGSMIGAAYLFGQGRW